MSVWPRAIASSRSCSVTSSQRQASVLLMAAGSRALVLAARLAGLVDGDADERPERRLERVPYPAREDLARGVLEAGDVVEVAVVELVVERLPGVVEALEVHEPAALLVERAGDGELDAEAMAVEARALVPLA